jgi:nicotinamidase-related amidase
MNRIDRHHSALLLVDFQQRLMPSIHGGAAAVAQAVFLAELARLLGLRVLGTEQNPDRLGPNEPAVRSLCERTLAKMHFDACRDGVLDALNEGRGPSAGPSAGPAGGPLPLSSVVIAGCEAHVCLMQTALGLRRAGLDVYVVAAACGSRSPQDHRLAMQRLAQAGAVIVSPEMVAFEWLDTCEHPQFRQALAMIKARGVPIDGDPGAFAA